jgi:hypothetical protein
MNLGDAELTWKVALKTDYVLQQQNIVSIFASSKCCREIQGGGA